MNIQEIKVEKFPVVIFTDSHTNIENIELVRGLYPNNDVISLGDFTFIFSKVGDKYNKHSINYFIKHKIPVLKGNHEEHILGCSTGDSFVKILPQYQDGHSLIDLDIYDLSQQQIDFLRKLPIGFKLILPDNSNYYCFHNRPNDLWSFTEEAFTTDSFRKTYPFDNKTLGIIQGHNHRNFRVDYVLKPEYYSISRYSIGQLCNSNHHTGENNGRNYALLTEKGIEFKKL